MGRICFIFHFRAHIICVGVGRRCAFSSAFCGGVPCDSSTRKGTPSYAAERNRTATSPMCGLGEFECMISVGSSNPDGEFDTTFFEKVFQSVYKCIFVVPGGPANVCSAAHAVAVQSETCCDRKTRRA